MEEYAVVAFLDVLGFRKIVEDWDRAKEYYGRLSAYLNAHRTTFDLAEEWVYGREMPGPEMAERPQTTTRLLSDSIVITSTDPVVALLRVIDILSMLLDGGIFLRGCIAHGRHVEVRSGEDFAVVSQALARAYEVESKEAVFPRVVLDPSFLGRLAENTAALINLGRFLVQSEDGHWFVNPFGHEGISMELAAAHVRKGIAEAEREDIRAKYLWLGDLMNFLAYPGAVEKCAYYDEPGQFSQLMRTVKALGEPVVETYLHRETPVRFLRFRHSQVRCALKESFADNVGADRLHAAELAYLFGRERMRADDDAQTS